MTTTIEHLDMGFISPSEVDHVPQSVGETINLKLTVKLAYKVGKKSRTKTFSVTVKGGKFSGTLKLSAGDAKKASKLAVTAPVSGLVLQKAVRPGDLSAIGSEPWFRIARDGEIELLAQLSETDLAKVRAGQHARVTLPSGAATDGVIRLVSPQVDAQTKLGAVRVRLPVRPDIRAGGFGRAVFTDVSGAVLAAPETAIRYDADGASVMVLGPDNRVRHVAVQTGQRGGGYVQLTKGPPAGSKIVQNAAAFLLDGDLIKPQDVATAAATAPAPVTKVTTTTTTRSARK